MTYRVYVDEAGDLGLSAASSRHFVFSAVLVRDSAEALLRSDLVRLRIALGRRSHHALHFVRLGHSERLKAVQDVANSRIAAVVNAVVQKDQIPDRLPYPLTRAVHRPNAVYFSAMRLLLEEL